MSASAGYERILLYAKTWDGYAHAGIWYHALLHGEDCLIWVAKLRSRCEAFDDITGYILFGIRDSEETLKSKKQHLQRLRLQQSQT